jgi:hypothetical protein
MIDFRPDDPQRDAGRLLVRQLVGGRLAARDDTESVIFQRLAIADLDDDPRVAAKTAIYALGEAVRMIGMLLFEPLLPAPGELTMLDREEQERLVDLDERRPDLIDEWHDFEARFDAVHGR